LSATLARGEGRVSHFDLEPDPGSLLPENADAAHDQAYSRFREGYDERIKQR